MAQQAADVPARADAGDEQLLASMNDFLRHYRPAAPDPASRDLLDGRYRIELTQRLPHFDSKTALAYAATDMNTSGRALFALVCNPGTLQRHRVIQQIKAVKHPNLLTPVITGVAALSQPEEERFVIVYEQPAGKKLSDLLLTMPNKINDHYLCKNIIAPLVSALQRLSDLGVSHGALHADNIYFTDTPMLGDFLSEPCGLSQPFYYETLERQQAHPYGKGEGTTSHDYYALAVLVLYILHGPNHFKDMTPESLIDSIFREGLYNAMTRQKDVPEMFYDFLRGLLTSNGSARWSDAQLSPWLEGKRYNLLPAPALMDAVRPFKVGDTEATTRRHVAHLLYQHWAGIPEYLQSEQLHHWAEFGLRDHELAEHFSRIARAVGELQGTRNEAQINEQLMRVILLLDPDGPIRIGPLSFHIDGIDTLCAMFSMQRADKELQQLAKFIEFNMANFWLERQRDTHPEYTIPAPVNAIIMRLERLRVCIRNAGYGFGLERMLYELNPDLPCMSPFLAGYYVSTLPALLAQLDRLTGTLTRDQDPFDRHIAAFLTAKLGIQHDVKVIELEHVPALATHRGILALKLLALAQTRAGNLQLPGITHWLGTRILPALDYIRSRTLRRHIKALLAEHAKSGYTQTVAQLIISSSYTSADLEGYQKAWNLYNGNARRIVSYRKGELIEERSGELGLVISQLLAYLLFALTLWGMIRHG